jgi:hypothetical protein
MTDTVIPLHRLRCVICELRTNDTAKFAGHRCHPSKRAWAAGGSPATTADGSWPPPRLVVAPPAGDPQ